MRKKLHHVSHCTHRLVIDSTALAPALALAAADPDSLVTDWTVESLETRQLLLH